MINIAVFAEQEMRGNDFIFGNDASALLAARVVATQCYKEQQKTFP